MSLANSTKSKATTTAQPVGRAFTKPSFIHSPWAPAILGVGFVVVAGLIGLLLGTVTDFGYTRMAQILIMMVLLLGLGVVTGTAGMIALCQMSFAAAGAIVVEYMSVYHIGDWFGQWSFFFYMICGTLVAMVMGLIVGLPALRLRGVNLAVVTLSLAFVFDITIVGIGFPAQKTGLFVERPFGISGATDASALGATAAVVLVIVAMIAVGVVYLQRSRWGSSWKMVAFSERGTASAGTNVQVAKLSAFIVSAAAGGLAGGLFEMIYRQGQSSSYVPYASLVIYVLSAVVGSYLIDMAFFGGILSVIIPFILTRLSWPLYIGDMLFGVLGIQAITTGSNLGEDIRRGIRKRGRAAKLEAIADIPREAGKIASMPIPKGTGKPLLVVTDLGVQFGAVKANANVDITVTEGTILGLIGPNGAGKSTFIDAVTGFLPQHTGTVELDGLALDKKSPSFIARHGIRRTYQQDRVPSSLTVGAYVRFISGGRATRDEIDEVLDFFECPPFHSPLSLVDVGTKRLIEVAAGVAAKPKVLLLDEPAAGLDHEQHIAFGERLRQVPTKYGVTLLIIEHDLDLVRSVCSEITVLNFGEVLASGSQESVLSNPEVLKAYMGETELL
jgi:branched-chain amino acid transport system permease protein